MRRMVPLIVGLAVVVAGCAGLPGSPGTTATQAPGTDAPRTPSPPPSPDPGTQNPADPAETSTTGTPPGEPLAPGVTDRGIRNASRLLDAHTAALRERGVELDVERRVGVGAAGRNASRERNISYRLVSAPDLRQFRQTATVGAADGRTVHRSWLNASMERMLVRVEAGGETRYRIPPVGPAGSPGRAARLRYLVQADRLGALVRGAEFAVTNVSGSGERRRVTLSGSGGSTEGDDGDREVRLVVGPDGVIHALSATVTRASGPSFAYEYRVVRIGVETVDRPGWVASAPAPVDTRPTAGFRNCTAPYLAVENPGPDPLPAGTVVTVRLDGTDHRASLDDPLSAGSARALYLDAAGTLRVAAVDAVPANRTGMPDEADVTIRTAEGMLLSRGGIGVTCASAGGRAGGNAGAGGPSPDRADAPPVDLRVSAVGG